MRIALIACLAVGLGACGVGVKEPDKRFNTLATTEALPDMSAGRFVIVSSQEFSETKLFVLRDAKGCEHVYTEMVDGYAGGSTWTPLPCEVK